jgi:ABC-type spermidine/putrescine transport system permease subunit II
MNIFATDHPLDSRSEGRKPRLHLYFFGVLSIAFVACPFIAVVLWRLDAGDNGESTGGYTPAPFWVDLMTEAIVSLLAGFVCACASVLLVLLFRKLSTKRA